MFCPSCGFEYAQKTNYCKRCGEELNAAPQGADLKPPRFRVGGLFFIVALFGAVGLLINLISYHELIDNQRVSGLDALITFALGLALVGGITGALIRLLSRLITGQQRPNQPPAPGRVIIREAQSPPQISAPVDPGRQAAEPPSVIEGTTRRMAGVYDEPKAIK